MVKWYDRLFILIDRLVSSRYAVLANVFSVNSSILICIIARIFTKKITLNQMIKFVCYEKQTVSR